MLNTKTRSVSAGSYNHAHFEICEWVLIPWDSLFLKAEVRTVFGRAVAVQEE